MAGNKAFFTLAVTILDPIMARKVFNLPESSFPNGSLVSAEGAKALAEGVRRYRAELGLSLTGQAGKNRDKIIWHLLALAHPEDGMHGATLAYGHALYRKTG